MKKISAWKTIVLSIVTLGIYYVVWFARRRDEMVKHYKVSIPHWLWLIAPTPLSILAVFAVTALITIKNYEFSDPMFILLITVMTFLILLINGIQIWWAWQFGKATEKITRGKLTLGWVLVYIFLLGPVALYVFQYYFNQLPKKAEIGSKKYKPSQKFVSFSIIAIFISCIFWSGAGVLLTFWSEDTAPPAPQLTKEQYSKFSKANDLNKKYEDCINKLNADFPAENADSSQENAYNKAYDNCESIRIEQNAAADAYDKSVGL
jgi:hypothetical protein